MKKKHVIFSVLIFLNISIFSQRPLIGFSFCGGYKSNYQEQGVFLQARFIEKIDFHLGYSNGKFNGIGYSGGIKYLFLKKKFQPFIGGSYSRNFGNILKTKYQNLEAKYKIATNDFIYAEGGICLKHLPIAPENNFDFVFLLSVSINYRYSLSGINVSYVEGDYSPEAQKIIFNRAGNGIGGQISIGFLIGKKKGS